MVTLDVKVKITPSVRGPVSSRFIRFECSNTNLLEALESAIASSLDAALNVESVVEACSELLAAALGADIDFLGKCNSCQAGKGK